MQDHGTHSTPGPGSQRLYILTAAAAAACLLMIAPFFIFYDHSFVHPHRFENHLPLLVSDSTAFTWRDLVKPFQEFARGEYRPRFLTYLIILVDLKLRLALYAWGVPHPAVSVSWIPELLLAPFLLYRMLTELTGDRYPSRLAVMVYVTSTGFLSSATMLFMPGKPLSNFVFVAVLYLMSSAVKRATPGQLFHEIRSPAVYGVLLVTFAGLLLDEVAMFTFLLVPIVFVDRFVIAPTPPRNFCRMAKSALLFGVPALAFLAVVLLIAPAITRHFYGYEFDYFSTLFGFGPGAAGARSFYRGPYGEFGLKSLRSNFLSLFGISLVPWQIAPLVSNRGTGGVLSSQRTTAAQLLVLGLMFASVGRLAAKTEGLPGRHFRRLLVATVTFVVFLSVLSGRHVPYVTGYYYGSAFAVFFAMIVGFSCSAAARRASRAHFLAVAMVLLIAAIQVDNFHRINRSYIFIHDERLIRPTYAASLSIADDRPLTARELRAIWQAWRVGRLDQYLGQRAVSAGAIFLVVELRWLDKIRGSARPASAPLALGDARSNTRLGAALRTPSHPRTAAGRVIDFSR